MCQILLLSLYSHETSCLSFSLELLFFFMLQNGGQVLLGGNNFPLRGNKATIWEGGTRSAAFVHAPHILGRSNEVF